MRKQSFYKLALLTGFFAFSNLLNAQSGYKVVADPQINGKKILTLPPVVQKAPVIKQTQNALDAEPTFKQAAIQHQAFVMINPKTKKPINPNAKLVLKLPDGTTRTFTAKQFYDQANELEKQLNARGRSLRNANAFRGMRTPVRLHGYAAPTMQKGFITNYVTVPETRKESGGRTQATTTQTTNVNTNTGKNITLVNNQGATPGFLKLNLTWKSSLFIAEMGSTHGTTEFPAEWSDASLAGKGKKTFPLIIAVPKGAEGSIKKAEWQVSDKPFDKTLKDYKTGVLKTGTVETKWSTALNGKASIKNWDKLTYSSVYINMGEIAPEPAEETKPYYARAILYNESNEIANVTDQVLIRYGAETFNLKIAMPEVNTVPGFNYAFPEDNSIPFGVFVRGSGLRTYKSKKYTDAKFTNLVTQGYKATADANIGIRYFNFLSLVSSSEPTSKEMSIIRGTFNAIAGDATGATNQNEPNGVSLDVSVLDGTIKYPIKFTETIPGTNSINLNYNVKETFDKEVVNTWFFVGPVPIHLWAGFGGAAGLDMSGSADLANETVTGTIVPYVTTNFYAGGGVDAIIAFATVNAKVDPLLALDLPMSFSSAGENPLSFSANLKGLKGKIYLRVGFYYPCPDLEKIVGWLTGDEDVPFCECAWEYNIFEFPGFEHKWSY